MHFLLTTEAVYEVMYSCGFCDTLTVSFSDNLIAAGLGGGGGRGGGLILLVVCRI